MPGASFGDEHAGQRLPAGRRRRNFFARHRSSPPELAASARQDKNIIWYVNFGAQDAQRDISFTVSYNQAFLRTCKGMRCSEELAYNGDMTTDVSMNATNSILLDIQYHYIGKSYGPSRTIGNVSVGPAYYQVRCDDLLLECRFVSFWDVDDSNAKDSILSQLQFQDIALSGRIRSQQ